MNTNFNENDFDFDLNFLPQSTINVVNECKIEKQRQAVIRAKKKTIATDTLIRKYYAQKEKLEQTENVLFLSKEECKQVCIDYRSTLEQNASLEKDIEKLKIQNDELQQAATLAKNQCAGMTSHTHQLELLIKENETQIQALKIEKQLEKNAITTTNGKNAPLLDKQHETLISHICLLRDVVLGKKKLNKQHKAILQKYHKTKSETVSDDEEVDNCNDYEEADYFDSHPPSPLDDSHQVTHQSQNDKDLVALSDLNIERITKQELMFDKGVNKITNFDIDSDCSNNELVSEDTGCGSSPAFSDGDKCLHSPSYFINESPTNIENNSAQNAGNKSLTNSNTAYETHDTATSPILFDDEMLLRDSPVVNQRSSSPEYFITDIPLSSEIVTIKEKRKLQDAGTSPIRDIGVNHVATSPVTINNTDLVENDNIGGDFSNTLNHEIKTNMRLKDISKRTEISQVPDNRHTTFDNLSSHCEIEIFQKSNQEKKCLEEHNSQNSSEIINDDNEVEMILKKMRFCHKLVTPLPDTPSKMKRKISIDHILEPESENDIPEHQQLNTPHQVCPDVMKLREENKVLHSSISDLTKEILNIKTMVQNHIFSRENIDVNRQSYNKSSQNNISVFSNLDSNLDSISTCENVINNTNASNAFEIDSQETDNEDTYDIFVTDNSVSNLTDNNESEMRLNQSHAVIDEPCIKPKEDIVKNRKFSDQVVYENTLPFDEIETESFENKKVAEEVIHSRKIARKPRKLTKLDKFKNKLLPKYKVTKSIHTKRKLRPKPKPINITRNNKTDTEVLLNNKSAYEKALKVMSEIKAQKKDNIRKSFVRRPVKRNKFNNNDNTKTKNTTKNVKLVHSQLPTNHIVDINPVSPQEPPEESSVMMNAVGPQPSNETVEMNPISPTEPPTKNGTDLNSITSKETLKDSIEMNAVSLQQPSELTIDLNPVSPLEPPELVMDIVSTSPQKSFNKSMEELTSTCLNRPQKSNSKTDTSVQDPTYKCKDKENNHINKTNQLNNEITNEIDMLFNLRTTRSRSKILYDVVHTEVPLANSREIKHNSSLIDNSPQARKRKISDRSPETYSKRILRSSFVKANNDSVKSPESNKLSVTSLEQSPTIHKETRTEHKNQKTVREIEQRNIISYAELDESICEENNTNTKEIINRYPRGSILCKMIQKYGKETVRYASKKVSDELTTSICKKLEEDISNISELAPEKAKKAMDKLVEDIQTYNLKAFLTGFIMYLKAPERKTELYKKIISAPAPPMTKAEQVLLYVIRQLQNSSSSTVNIILTNIEFHLFQLKNSPEFDIVESMSHFYALLCRYFGLKNRLRLFILDGMYCLQFKVIPLIKQCLDVWMHVLPLAHMGIAKTPLVTCMVYLLHFYKCEDKFNRVQDLRFILHKKFFYQITDWNEMRILEMFRNAIRDLRDIEIEKKILRMAIIILAKRLGAKWCQKNIIKNMLLPMIDNKEVSDLSKQFCVAMLGPLLKPFPLDMKVHCEIMVNQLLDMLDQNPPDKMKEAIFTSLIYMNKHNQFRVTQTLLQWEPTSVSSDFEQLACDFVREKSIKVWKKILPKMM